MKFFTFFLMLLFSLTTFAQTLRYEWGMYRGGVITCFAVLPNSSQLADGGSPMPESLCRNSGPKPMRYEWGVARDSRVNCYAYSTIDGQILFHGVPVSDSSCRGRLFSDGSAGRVNFVPVNVDARINESDRGQIEKQDDAGSDPVNRATRASEA